MILCFFRRYTALALQIKPVTINNVNIILILLFLLTALKSPRAQDVMNIILCCLIFRSSLDRLFSLNRTYRFFWERISKRSDHNLSPSGACQTIFPSACIFDNNWHGERARVCIDGLYMCFSERGGKNRKNTLQYIWWDIRTIWLVNRWMGPQSAVQTTMWLVWRIHNCCYPR